MKSNRHSFISQTKDSGTRFSVCDARSAKCADMHSVGKVQLLSQCREGAVTCLFPMAVEAAAQISVVVYIQAKSEQQCDSHAYTH